METPCAGCRNSSPRSLYSPALRSRMRVKSGPSSPSSPRCRRRSPPKAPNGNGSIPWWANRFPDNRTAGIDTDLDTTDIAGGDCRQLFGLAVKVAVISSAPGGPGHHAGDRQQDRGRQPRDDLVRRALPRVPGFGRRCEQHPVAETDGCRRASHVADCSRFRLNVADLFPNNQGTLQGWSLGRRVAVYPFAHAPDYYQSLLFGTMTEPRRPPGAPNVADYFGAVSRGEFTFSNAGVLVRPRGAIGSAARTPSRSTTWLRCSRRRASTSAPSTATTTVVDSSELAIVDFSNGDPVKSTGKNRIPNPPSRPQCSPTKSGVRVCAKVAFLSQQVNFETLSHEISHSLSTLDLYGNAGDCYSQTLTLMSCTLNEQLADHMESLYLDPWHRIRLGWIAPIALSLGAMELGDDTWVGFYGQRSRPARVRKANDPHEYFLFEYRGRRGYDDDVAATSGSSCGMSRNPHQVRRRVNRTDTMSTPGSSRTIPPGDGAPGTGKRSLPAAVGRRHPATAQLLGRAAAPVGQQHPAALGPGADRQPSAFDHDPEAEEQGQRPLRLQFADRARGARGRCAPRQRERRRRKLVVGR